jgi:hypothetical protein
MIAVPSSVRFFGAEGTSGALQPRQITTVIKRIAVATVPIRLQFRNPTATLYATAMMTIPIVHRTICVLGARVSAPLVLDDRQQRLPTNGASYDVHVRLPEPAPVTTLPSNLFMNLLRDVAPMARPNLSGNGATINWQVDATGKLVRRSKPTHWDHLPEAFAR